MMEKCFVQQLELPSSAANRGMPSYLNNNKIKFKPPRMLTLKQNILTLKGLTLRGSLELLNPNENLAVIFEVQCPSDIPLSVEPKRGIVMQSEIKNIRVWVEAAERERVMGISFVGKSLRINMTMKAEYNRKMLEKLNLPGWDKAKKSFSSIEVPIVISSQASILRSQLKNEASSSLNKISSSRELAQSSKLKNYKDQFKAGQSYSHSRPYKVANSDSNKKISDKLDRELDFLFENEVSRHIDRKINQKERLLPNFLDERAGEVVEYRSGSGNDRNKLNFDQGEVVSYGNGNSNRRPAHFGQQNGQTVTYNPASNPYQNPFSNPKPYLEPIQPQSKQIIEYNRQANNQRFLQVLMLAALAGFFAALGSNLKHLFI